MATAEGYYVGGDDWYAYVNITKTSETETSGTFQVKAWMYVGPGGSSTYSTNVKGWAGIWDSANGYRWSSEVNLGVFSEGQGWISSYETPFKSQSWTVAKTHSSQKVYGYSDIQGKAGVYNGKESKASAYVTLAAKTSYAVKYSANGGSGAPSAQTKWHGETLALSSDKPTRTGYTFAGWNTKADGTGSNYASGANYTSNSATTLYAKWTPNTYTISYNANGGSGTMANQTKQHGVEQTLRSNTFTRTGYNFKNYNTASNGSGTSYSSGGAYTANASVTLYAQWTIQTYSIKYDANGGTGAPSAQTKTYNTTLKLSTTKPSRTGYNFLGWNTSKTATTATYAAGANYTANSAATLYAIWQVAAPSLTIIDCYRADSTGAAADEGTYAKVEAHWSHLVESTLSWTCSCNEVSTSTPSSSSTAADNLSGDVTFLLDTDMSLDQEYAVTLSLQDGGGTTTKSSSIGSAFFTLDVKAGGHGIAFGKPSTTDGLMDVGMDLNVDGDTTLGGSLTVAEPLDPTSGGTGQNTLQKAGSAIINALTTGTSAPKDADYYVCQYAGGGTTTTSYHRRPMSALWTWIKEKTDDLYLKLSGGSTTGSIYVQATGYTDGTAPSSTTGLAGFGFKDKAGTTFGTVAPYWYAGGTQAIRFRAVRGSDYHHLYMGVNPSGEPTVAFGQSSSTKSAKTQWHRAISGWTSIATTTGTTAKTIDLGNYSELLVCVKYSSTFASSLVVPVDLITTTATDWYMGGWSNTYYAGFKIKTTQFTPYKVRVNGTDQNGSWTIYAR